MSNAEDNKPHITVILRNNEMLFKENKRIKEILHRSEDLLSESLNPSLTSDILNIKIKDMINEIRRRV